MASNILFCFVLISTWPIFTSSRTLCPRIFFQNINEWTMPYKMIEGVYIHNKNDYYNNFPVYHRENSEHYLGLYYHINKKGDKFLVFARKDLGDDFLYQYGVTARLSSDPSSWLSSGTLDRSDVFGGLVHHWQYHNRNHKNDYNVSIAASFPMIKAVCVGRDFRECNSDRVYFWNERMNNNNGNNWDHLTKDYFYRVAGLFRNLRPVYKHSAKSWYLQYVNGYWVVSESYWTSDFKMRVKDVALRPEYITKTWSQWLGMFGWRLMPGLRVMCRGVTSMANICQSSPCDNIATCVFTFGNETLCVCAPGFTGLTCSVNKQCPASNNLTYLGKRPGDLGLSFCSGWNPSTRFYLCVDGNNSSYWSGLGSACKDEYGTTTPPPTAIPGPRTQSTPKAKIINFDDKPISVPLVLNVAFHLQIFLPIFLWCCASCWRKYKEAKYRQRMEHSHVGDELRLTPGVTATGGPGELEQGGQESQSDSGMNEQGFYRSRKVTLSRIFSMDMNFSFYLWLIYLVGCEVSHCTRYGEVFYMLRIFAIVMLCLSPAIVLLESFFCDELDYLRNIIEDETALEYLQRIRGVPPKINMVVECYHFETDTRVVHYRDPSGNRHSRTGTYVNTRRKILTFVDREVFSFDSWVDVSKREMLAESNSALTRVQIDSSIQFGDQQTADAYERQVAEMIRRNRHRDVLYEYSSTKEVPGLKKRISAYANLNVKPFWIRPLFFWIATLLQMTWPYRWLFRAKTDKGHYVLKKMVYKRTTPPREVDPDIGLAGNVPSAMESSGPDNTHTGDPVLSAMTDVGTGNPPLNPYLGQMDLTQSLSMPYSAYNPNAGALLLHYLATSHPNVPLLSSVAGMNNPAPDTSTPCPQLSSYTGRVFPPFTAGPLPSVPPPSYEASMSHSSQPRHEKCANEEADSSP